METKTGACVSDSFMELLALILQPMCLSILLLATGYILDQDHSSHHNGTLNCVISLIHNFPVKHIVIVFLSIRNVPLTHFLGKNAALSVYFLLFEKKILKFLKK